MAKRWASSWIRVIRQHAIGDTVKLHIYRNKQEMDVYVTLIEYVPAGNTVNFGG